MSLNFGRFDLSFYSAAISLLLVMDPFGNIPIFLSILKHIPSKKKKIVILREMCIALVILTLFLFFGRYILTGMRISEPALSISGGVVLFIISLKMIFPSQLNLINVVDLADDHKKTQDGTSDLGQGDQNQSSVSLSELETPMIVPLAVPLIAGPSSMATIILFSTRSPEKKGTWFLALLSAWIVSCIILVLAEHLGRVLGNRILKAIERLMGMILITLAVQMLLSGIQEFMLNSICLF